MKAEMAELTIPRAPTTVTEAINLAGPKTWSLHYIVQQGKKRGGIIVIDTEGRELARFDARGNSVPLVR